MEDQQQQPPPISEAPAPPGRRKSVVADQASHRVQKQPGELLSPEEKKANHIASEKKRRAAIRVGFDKITAIVPDLDPSQGRSEAVVLTKTVDFLTALLEENDNLKQLADENNVPLELKEVRRYPYLS